MKVFVFGAGASQGSQDGYVPEVKAPLVNQLFDVEFDQHYKSFAEQLGFQPSDLANYQEEFQKVGNLEEWLTRLWAEYDTKKNEFSRRANRAKFGRITFYIWLLMQKVSDTYKDQNGYRLLLSKLEQEDDDYGFISFNYDTLLDRALVEYGANLAGTLSSYSEVKYAKPHGSVNWFLKKRDLDTSLSSEQHYDLKVRVGIASNGMYADTPIPFKLDLFEPSHSDIKSINILSNSAFGHQYAYPFILIPLTSKLYGHFEKYKENVIDQATKIASEADEIYLVGYRAADEVIKDIFSDVKEGAKLHCVSRNDAQAIQSSVLKWQPKLKAGETYKSGFLDFINNYDTKVGKAE